MATTKTYTTYGNVLGFSIPVEYYNNTSTSSKVGKRVNLRQSNPHDFTMRKLTRAKKGGSWTITSAPDGVQYIAQPSQAARDKAEQTALVKFNGKLRKGSASMGVTLASWKQSQDMILSRLGKLSNVLSGAERKIKKDKTLRRKLQRKSEAKASDVLEVEFGWLPLFEDLKACLTTVCQDGIPDSWVSGRHRYVDTESSVGSTQSISGVYSGMCTVAANVAVTNPNLWLLNRLGLINPGVVIWDLIPWSFVVNMFVNVNSMIASVTQHVGLSITGVSTTHSFTGLYTKRVWVVGQPQNYHETDRYYRRRWRTVGSLPQLKWMMKVPKLSWELCLIAGSLLVQQMSRITKLITAPIKLVRSL